MDQTAARSLKEKQPRNRNAFELEKLLPYMLILLSGYAFYNIALRFVPIDFDDLVLLSSVKHVSSPLEFFIGDWGFGNYGYRPLHSLTLWLSYRLLGVSSGPNQLLNILLHCAVVMLLYALLEKLLSRRHWALALALAGLGLISLYTVSPPTWVSDRPSLLVALCLLALLNYFARLAQGRLPKTWLMAALSILALLSKESGLIVPLVALYFIFCETPRQAGRIRSAAALVIILFCYAGLRFMAFGAQAATYTESGYLMGRTYYENLGMLQGMQRLAAYAENSIKNILAVFLPVFDGQGKLSLIGTKLNSLVVLVCTLVIFILSLGKKLTRFQKLALVIILLNGLVHFQLFRYRTLYIAQLAFLIFIASSQALQGEQGWRRAVVFTLAGLLVFWNIHMLGENLDFELVERVTRLAQPTFEQEILASSKRIDPEIVSQIIAKYRH